MGPQSTQKQATPNSMIDHPGTLWGASAGRGREEGVQKSRTGSEESWPLCILSEFVVRGAFRKHARAYSVYKATSRHYSGHSNSKHT